MLLVFQRLKKNQELSEDTTPMAPKYAASFSAGKPGLRIAEIATADSRPTKATDLPFRDDVLARRRKAGTPTKTEAGSVNRRTNAAKAMLIGAKEYWITPPLGWKPTIVSGKAPKIAPTSAPATRESTTRVILLAISAP